MQASILLLALWAPVITGLSWRNDKRPGLVKADSGKSSEIVQNSRLPDIYAVALSELQELESEPLCHRVAARLLVNNCQLVDGKDEATILTDSGRKVRDFVDSYAASLAICDLERGGFTIPKECAKLREPSLAQIAMRDDPQLHVSPAEIGLCLSALAASDAAWSTWVSYRHKALRFCEAARVDNEKAQNILLYQRLTKVIAKLTDGVEADLEKRMQDLDDRARQSVQQLEQLTPRIEQLNAGLARVHNYLSEDLELALKKTAEFSHGGLEHAENLQQLLAALISNVHDSNTQLASAHQRSVRQASQRMDNEMGALMAVVSSAIVSSTSLQQQIQLSDMQATTFAQRQDMLEEGMDRLVTATEKLSTKFDEHSTLLKQASNITNDILDTLEETAATASSLSESFFSRVTTHSWWPFVVFPTASLVMGSYGLPPSMLRNIGLLAFGEAVGFTVSWYEHISTQLFGMVGEVATNATVSAL
ncbi:nuclear fusion protein KAR5 [Dichotomopilus funicola]|uniref:Nuclear fusion protein KAR5 n=1 Tax=Dichotomopilus funicola TaxID=1934379 RepID=A0AAN6V9Y4_9PEZI|nr:nuclear fusion protein KAR5 [Dichotomopilus funicola]